MCRQHHCHQDGTTKRSTKRIHTFSGIDESYAQPKNTLASQWRVYFIAKPSRNFYDTAIGLTVRTNLLTNLTNERVSIWTCDWLCSSSTCGIRGYKTCPRRGCSGP